VQQTGSSRSTRAVSDPEKQTGQIESEVERLRLQNEIMALDIGWTKERENHLVRNNYGAQFEPSASTAIGLGIWKVIVGGVLIAFVSGKLHSSPYEDYMKKTGTWVEHSREYGQTEVFLIFLAVVLILWGAGGAYLGCEKAARFEAAKKRYQTARTECEAKLRKLL
jgi:hypothetical protein